MKNTKLLAEGIKKAGFNLLCKPSLNIVAFRGKNTKNLAEKLVAAGLVCLLYSTV